MSVIRSEYTQGLRELAEILDANPDIPLPYEGNEIPAWVFCYDLTKFGAAVRKLGGGRKSIDHQGNLNVYGSVAGYRYRICMMNEVCELVETGEVEEYEEREVISPERVRMIAKTRPVYERKCPESLLSLTQDIPSE